MEAGRFAHLVDRSILTHLPPLERASLLDSAVLIDFAAGSKLNPQIVSEKLYILLEGRVTLNDPESGAVLETVVPGRSFELDSLMTGSARWQTDWLALTSGVLLCVPFPSFMAAVERASMRPYIEKIVLSVELQKIKNDLRLLGVPSAAIQKIISDLKAESSLASLAPGSLVVVKKGSVKATFEWKENRFDLKRFSVSDYFIMPEGPSYELIASEDLIVWVLSDSSLRATLLRASDVSFLDLLKQASHEVASGESVRQEQDESVYDHPDDEQNDLRIEDFYASERNPSGIAPRAVVPILQHDQMDCGAACMAMISHAYGKKISVAAWRSLIFVTREGASMLAVKQGATRVGFEAIGIMSGLKHLQEFRLPFIALMNYHYVVVHRITDKEFFLADPARGLVTVSHPEFSADYSQNCLLIRPTARLQEFPESLPAYRKYLPLFRSAVADVAVVVLFSVVLFVLSLAPPLFIQFVFDHVLRVQDPRLLKKVGIIMVSLTFFMSVAGYIRSLMLSKLANGVGVKLTTLFFRHTLRLPFDYFAVRNVGDITTRVEELDKIRHFFSYDVAEVLVNGMAVLLYTSILYLYHPTFAGLAIAAVVLVFAIMRPLFRRFVGLMQDFFHASGRNHTIIFEQLRGLRTIQALASTVTSRWIWEESYDRILKIRKKVFEFRGGFLSISTIIQQFVWLAFLVCAIRLFDSNELTIGQVVAVSGLSVSLVNPVIQLVQAVDRFSNVRVAFEKIDEIVTSPTEEKDAPAAFEPGSIRFQNVWFRYGSDFSPWVLKGIDLEIRAGEKVALVGPSGSGKSTLAYLVNLIYRPTSGEVRIGDRLNVDIDLQSLREKVAVILQEDALFPGTVLENIAFGEDTPDLERATRAAHVAEAFEFIMDLPQGFSTLLGPGARELSVGQRQRVSIARAVYREPAVMILDEATSSLDSITEKRVLQNLKQELSATTCFTISHRLNTVIDSDRILMIAHGKISEQGTHEELMKRQSRYYELFRRQIHSDARVTVKNFRPSPGPEGNLQKSTRS